MIKRDANQDADRPHYYSQYWIDVAMGKPTTRVAEAVGGADEDDMGDDDLLASLPSIKAEPAKPAKPAKAPEKKPDTARSLSSLADLANIDMLMKNSAEMGDSDALADSGAELDAPAIVTDFDVDEIEEEPDTEPASLEALQEFDYDEDEEEEDEWGGRKPGKPARPTKPTKPARQPRPRREF